MVAVAALSLRRIKELYCMKNIGSPVMLNGMNRYVQWPLMASVALMLGACGTMRSSVVVEPAAGTTYHQSEMSPRPRNNTHVSAPSAAHTPIPGGTYVVTKGDTLYSIAFRNGVDVRDLAQWNGVVEPYTIWPKQQLTLSPSTSASHTPVAIASSPIPAAQSPSASRPPTAPIFEPISNPSAASAAAVSSGAAKPATVSRSAPVPIPATPPASSVVAVVPVAGVPAPAPASVPPPAPREPGVSRAVSGVSWRWPAEGKLTGKFSSGDAIPGIEIAGKAGDPVRAAADGVVVYSGNGLVGYGELVIIKHNDSFLSAYGHNRKRLVKEGQRVSSGQQIAEMGSTGATRNELEFQIRKDGNPVDPLGYLPPR
jgi:lipoprotein NlpD